MKTPHWVLHFFFYTLCSFVLYARPERDLDEADWNTPRPERQYKSLEEERFQMECNYLGIKGERKKKAREFFEFSQQQRELVKENTSAGKLTLTSAIKKLNRIDIEYYEQLTPLVSGKKNKARLEGILDKLREMGNGQVSMQKCQQK
ncbi:MAG TPA: hypothetical protein VM123_15030 [archaeon]|nr:hypothetical protein [archaeon]